MAIRPNRSGSALTVASVKSRSAGVAKNIVKSWKRTNGSAVLVNNWDELPLTGVAAPQTPLTGTLRYVAVGGSNAAAGTLDAPWATVDYGLSQIQAGQTLVIRGGTHDVGTINRTPPAGTSGNRVRVCGYPGERAVLTGLIRMFPAYYTFDHLVFRGRDSDPMTQHTVRLTNARGVVIEDCDFEHQSGSFASLHIAEYPTSPAGCSIDVRRCYFRRNDSTLRAGGGNGANRDHHIYVGGDQPMVATSVYTIERNIFEDAPNGDHIKYGGADGSGNPTVNFDANVIVRYNTGSRSIQSMDNEGLIKNLQVYRNLFHDATVDRPSGGSQGASFLLYNVSNTSNVTYYENWLQARVKTFANTGSTTSGTVTAVTGTGNVFSTTADPQFTDPANGDYRPQNTAAQAYGRYANL